MSRELNLAEKFRDLRGDYSAAKQSRFRRRRTGLAPMGSGADYHYRSEADYLRIMETARDMDRNDCVVGQIIDRAVANEIQDGFTLSPLTGDNKLNQDLAAWWYEESIDADKCDLAGELAFWGQEQAVSRAEKIDGSILGLGTVGGQIELVEAHRLRTPTYNKKANIVHGVELDLTTRRPLRYWLTADDVGTGQAALKINDFRPVDARDADGLRQVFHPRLVKRPTQTRGISALSPIFDIVGMHDDIQFAQLLQKQIVTCFAIFREREANFQQMLAAGLQPGAKTEALPDGTEREIVGMGPGREFVGFPGEKFKLDSPRVPSPEFFPHCKLILTLIGINLGLPLVMVLMDGSETNFSGWRGAVDQARMGFRTNQRRLAEQWHTPIYLWRLRRRIAEEPALRSAAASKEISIYHHRWNMPTWPYIQPLQDASADLLRVRNALISQRRRCAERNMEWADLLVEICEDNAALIAKAHETAEQLNEKHPGLNVTWREIANLPTPDGVQIGITTGETGDERRGTGGGKQAKEQVDGT
jgi:capsid protein